MSLSAPHRQHLAAQDLAEPEVLVLERFLPYRLNVLAGMVSNALAEIYAERFGLSIPAWRVIATLGQYQVCTARDIAAHGVMHKSTVSRAVASLEERGLVASEPNAQDMREALLRLTPQGQAIYEALLPEALAFERRLAATLSPAEHATFLGLVERLDAHARAMAGEARQEPAP